jgi:hypothetical protein
MGYKKRTDVETDKITETSNDLSPENMPQGMPDDTPDIDAEAKQQQQEQQELRKLEIAEKRRASLALARSKIIPKSQLKKQAEEAVKTANDVVKSKDEVIKIKQEETDAMRLKYERERVKQLEDSLNALQKLIVEKPVAVPVVPAEPVKYKRPSRAKAAIAERVVERVVEKQPQQPQQIIPKKSVEPRMIAREAPVSTEKLIDKSYGEQLQERLRSQAINKIMSETFGGF